MPLEMSRRNSCAMQSEIRNMTIQCSRIGGINLSQGLSDLMPPKPVIEAVKKAMDDGFNIYSSYSGLPLLRAAIAGMYSKRYGIEADPDTGIVVTAGATGAFFCAAYSLLNPGDEVIVFEPFYGYHVNTLKALDVVPVFVRMQPPDWRFSYDELDCAITDKTKGILINTPANPTGKVFLREELEMVSGVAAKHDLFVFTDEIYEHFLYEGFNHVPPITLPGMRERTVMIGGASKMFSVTGWRIGWCLCDESWARAIGLFNDVAYICAPSPFQAGVAAGITGFGEDYYTGLRNKFAKKRSMLCEALSASGINPYPPQGAYYVFADIRALPGATSRERAMYLLEKTGVACVPGSAFYHDDSGENLARFCFAKEDDVLEDACSRLELLKKDRHE
jgi:aminotransferase